jgi:hypothetical protein
MESTRPSNPCPYIRPYNKSGQQGEYPGSGKRTGRRENDVEQAENTYGSIVVHRPHPSNKAVPEAVEDIREFLTRMGDTP